MEFDRKEYLLVKRRQDGEIFTHSTKLAGHFNDSIYSQVTGVYDSDGYLKARFWQVPRTDETQKAERDLHAAATDAGNNSRRSEISN